MGKAKLNLAFVERILKKKSKDKGGGSRKYGRNRSKCDYYRKARSVRNKINKLKQHLAQHPADTCAQTAIQKARVVVYNT